jgi:hypothetical protein
MIHDGVQVGVQVGFGTFWGRDGVRPLSVSVTLDGRYREIPIASERIRTSDLRFRKAHAVPFCPVNQRFFASNADDTRIDTACIPRAYQNRCPNGAHVGE